MKVTTSVSFPMRRNAVRASGSIDQPTSWPCVLAITRLAPASRASGVSSASGAAAPNHTVSMSRRAISRRIRTATDGSGTIKRGRVPHHVVAVRRRPRRRIPRQPSHFGAYTVSVWTSVCDQFPHQVLQVGLDAAAARRKVIGHQQNPGHRRQASRSATGASRTSPRSGRRRGRRGPRSRRRGGRGRTPPGRACAASASRTGRRRSG